MRAGLAKILVTYSPQLQSPYPPFITHAIPVRRLAVRTMVHWWQDPAVEAILAVVHVDMIFLLLGVFGYVFHP